MRLGGLVNHAEWQRVPVETLLCISNATNNCIIILTSAYHLKHVISERMKSILR